MGTGTYTKRLTQSADSFLLQYKEICALHGPSKFDVNALYEWLIRPECGDNFLRGVVSRSTFCFLELSQPDHFRNETRFILGMNAGWKTSELPILSPCREKQLKEISSPNGFQMKYLVAFTD